MPISNSDLFVHPFPALILVARIPNPSEYCLLQVSSLPSSPRALKSFAVLKKMDGVGCLGFRVCFELDQKILPTKIYHSDSCIVRFQIIHQPKKKNTNWWMIFTLKKAAPEHKILAEPQKDDSARSLGTNQSPPKNGRQRWKNKCQNSYHFIISVDHNIQLYSFCWFFQNS